ncbi:GGDEF domain-containing protein [Paraburkholderia sp. 40]|uniref:GGDEF domain-containing protein n=1 Tax=Paraburkholderia sp. 40 TaxID=2991059 RepID=UPI003D262AF5
MTSSPDLCDAPPSSPSMDVSRTGGSTHCWAIDCDRFKSVNDTLAHHTGDLVLQGVVDAIKGSIRGWDLACRWGGDEFVVLLPRTKPENGRRVAERIRMAAEGMQLHGVTLSTGVATSTKGESLAAVIVRADSAMYGAKRAGRNAVVIA